MPRSYIEKLKDPRWQRRRLEILSRANFACEECWCADRTLHIHHRFYRRGAEPWEYSDAELQCLCEDCHAAVTRSLAELTEDIGRLTLFDQERVVGYIRWLVNRRSLSEDEMCGRHEALQLPFDGLTGPFAEGFGNALGLSDSESGALAAKDLRWRDVLDLFRNAQHRIGADPSPRRQRKRKRKS